MQKCEAVFHRFVVELENRRKSWLLQIWGTVLKELGFLFLLNENNGPGINEDTMELTFAI